MGIIGDIASVSFPVPLDTHATVCGDDSPKGPPGGPLSIQLKHPFTPLKAATLGSLTKNLLAKYGVPQDWGAHSTREAGVLMYKLLGLSSDEVCRIGQWKSVQAFAAHYVRLGAATGVRRI